MKMIKRLLRAACAGRSRCARNDNRGETLLEAMIAIGMLMTVLGSVAELQTRSIQSTAANRAELVAAALAEDALETAEGAVKTNALKFSSKSDVCWDAETDHSVAEDCENHKIRDGTYRLGKHLDSFKPVLELMAQDLDPDDPSENYRLLLDNASHLYNYETGSSTPFYRSLEIRHLDLLPVAGDGNFDAIRATALVSFFAGRQKRAIKLSSIITRLKQ